MIMVAVDFQDPHTSPRLGMLERSSNSEPRVWFLAMILLMRDLTLRGVLPKCFASDFRACSSCHVLCRLDSLRPKVLASHPTGPDQHAPLALQFLRPVKAPVLTLITAGLSPLSALAQGPLDPPGEPRPTQKSLQQIWDKTETVEGQVARLESQVGDLGTQVTNLESQVDSLQSQDRRSCLEKPTTGEPPPANRERGWSAPMGDYNHHSDRSGDPWVR